MTAIRFVEMAIAIRVLMRKEVKTIKMAAPDYFLLLSFFVYMLVTFFRTGLIDWYTIGLAVDGSLIYFSFRALIQTPEEFTHLIKGMAFLLVPFSLLMLQEALTGRNFFAFMGEVPETPVYRDGYFRCQGSFRHAITAGTLGATFIPIFIGLLVKKNDHLWGFLGTAACLIIVITSHSSGPLMATIVAFAAWSCWFIRRHTKWIKLIIICLILLIHFMMKAPVWYIFDRISGIIGGDGWHRSNLIDKFIKSFDEWWMVGMPMEKTVNWAATVTKFGTADLTNHYVSLGINGGLISLVIFLVMLMATFRLIGLALQSLRIGTSRQSSFAPLLWGVGGSVSVHAINLTAVSYWDQSYVIWYLHLAVAVTLGNYFLKTSEVIERRKVKPQTSIALKKSI